VTGRLKVQDGHPPGWFCRTAEADGTQEASCLFAADTGLSLSDTVCGGFASVGFMSKRSDCNDSRSVRLSTVMRAASAAGA
jgi:hypothetical protein